MPSAMAFLVTSTAGSSFPSTMALNKGFKASFPAAAESLTTIVSCLVAAASSFERSSLDTSEEEEEYSSTMRIACSTSLSLWKSISRCTPSAPILSSKGFSSSKVTQQAMILLPPARIFL